MASSVLSPNPYLVAILLVCSTRTGSGAQLLFHYPARPLSQDESQPNPHPTNNQTDDEEDDDATTDSEASTTDGDDFFALPSASNKAGTQSYSSKFKVTGEGDDHTSANTSSQQNGSRKQQPETIFGLAEDGLVSLLSPDRTWHKRKFELGINDLTFVGRPVFVRPDGFWRRQERRKQQAPNHDQSASDTAAESEEMADSNENNKTLVDANDKDTSITKSPLLMFHVVFVMNPPPLEHALRVKDIYDRVIKKFSRALKWEQSHHNYVWKETEIMSTVKASEETKQSSRASICSETIIRSSLAAAISSVYVAISNSRIALVTLSPKVSFSLQIPPVTSTSSLPSLTSPPIQPGLWLTTATDISSMGSDLEGTDPGNALHLAKHYTLLLKSPPHRIAKDALESGDLLAAHLPKFVSSLRPTKSFYKLSINSQISLTDIQAFAQHLIYWRRAIAIPPLHSKDVYIVSPNADMRKLRNAIKNYEQQFASSLPNMPSLPKILSILSGIPRTFGSLIPSSDHKEIYYFALAWLMRNGWVTQLRTFAYVRVDPEVKGAIKDTDRETNSQGTNRQKAQRDEPVNARELNKPRKRPSIVSRPSSDGKPSVDSIWPAHNPRMASLILNPSRASPEESKWLEYIQSTISNNEDSSSSGSFTNRADLQKYWPSFVKYFNGHVALEAIPVREGHKRKLFWSMMSKAGVDPDRGVDDENGQKAILVTVRHW